MFDLQNGGKVFLKKHLRVFPLTLNTCRKNTEELRA